MSLGCCEKVYFPGTVQGATPVTAKGLAVTLTDSGGVLSIAAASSGAGDGILEDPGGVNGAAPVQGDSCSVVAFGVTKGYASATVTRGMFITADASGGQLEQATGTEVVIGTAMTGVTTSGYFDIFVGLRLAHAGS